jgi:hypothetical protein
MKPLENKFNTMIESYPELSSLICFYRAVREVGPNTRTIAEGLQKLVDKKDYSRSDAKDILTWLENAKKISHV